MVLSFNFQCEKFMEKSEIKTEIRSIEYKNFHFLMQCVGDYRVLLGFDSSFSAENKKAFAENNMKDNVIINNNIDLPPCEEIGMHAFAATTQPTGAYTRLSKSEVEFLEPLSYTLPDDLIKIGQFAFEYCKSMNAVIFPLSLKEIDKYAFANAGLTEAFIPENVEKIGECAFAKNRSLKEAYFFANTKMVPASCFNDCSSLEKILLSSSVEKIGSMAFSNTAIEHFDCGEYPNLKIIGNNSFNSCDYLTSVKITKNIKSVEDQAFAYCNMLKNLEIEEGIEHMGSSVFALSSIENITIPESVVSLKGTCTDMQCLTSAVIKSHVHVLPPFFFRNCKRLENLKFGPDLVTFGTESLSNTGFTSFEFPKTVKSINSRCISGQNLKEIRILNKDVNLQEPRAIDSKTIEIILIPPDKNETLKRWINFNYHDRFDVAKVVKTFSLDTLLDSHASFRNINRYCTELNLAKDEK